MTRTMPDPSLIVATWKTGLKGALGLSTQNAACLAARREAGSPSLGAKRAFHFTSHSAIDGADNRGDDPWVSKTHAFWRLDGRSGVRC